MVILELIRKGFKSEDGMIKHECSVGEKTFVPKRKWTEYACSTKTSKCFIIHKWSHPLDLVHVHTMIFSRKHEFVARGNFGQTEPGEFHKAYKKH